MTAWEKKIIDALIGHYFASAPEMGENRSFLRLSSSVFFPGFDTADPDEKVSYLEAAESLERKGIIKLSWEKRGKGERLKTLSCENFERLFEETGKPFPKTEAEEIRSMLGARAGALRESQLARSGEYTQTAKRTIDFLDFCSLRFGPRDTGQAPYGSGIDTQTMEDLIRFLEFALEPARLEKVTTRALSILLYRDSKRLENLLAVCKPLLDRAHNAISLPEIANYERSYPDTMISGKIAVEFGSSEKPMVNSAGVILGFPLESAEEVSCIRPVSDTRTERPAVLTIENKETFYALGSPQRHGVSVNLSRYDCFLYTGGYSNRAAAALIRILAASGFAFYHAGDLDPDGVLILQHVQETAGRPVSPVRMDAAAFDQYRAWGRTLAKPMLRQIDKIGDETRAIPGLAELIDRFEETGLGVEQEIVDYR